MGVRLFGEARQATAEFLVMGRTLSLPSFVATLVTTWYGGVLGVGEYSYRYGISNWLVFGVPYYLGAALFALFLAERARRSELYTVPDQLARAYGREAGLLGAGVLQLMSSPAPYVLMVGILLQMLFGWPLWVAVVAGTLVATAYSLRGGMRSVVNADNVQFVLMFAGFLVTLPYLALRFGGLGFLHSHLPREHFTWHGGNSPQYIFVWYLIALQTLVEPTFYQRAYAASTPAVARRGVFLSIGFWALFDFLSTFTGMYARALLPHLKDPASSYPALAVAFLPPVLQGVFYLGLLATVMSTVDGYTFIGAVNFGRDLVWRWRREADEGRVNRYVQAGFALTAAVSVAMALFFRSAVDLWHDVGSFGVATLLVPLCTSYSARWRMRPAAAIAAMLLGGGISLAWLLAARLRPAAGTYPLGLEPIYAGVLLALGVLAADRLMPRTRA